MAGAVPSTTVELTQKDMEVRPSSINDVKVDPTFRKISKNSICFHVWRIEDDRLEAEPKQQFGTFFDDCAYIIYAAAPLGIAINHDTINREAKPGTQLESFIHFWLGEHVSEQKRTNVTHKVQELDSYLGNVSTQFRETQDHESARYLSYFKKGMFIRCGALAKPDTRSRLYKLRARKWVRCIEMPSVSWQHFSCDENMLLQTEKNLFLWISRASSNLERCDAVILVDRMPSEAENVIVVDDGYEQMMPEPYRSEWNLELPFKQRIVNQDIHVGDKQSVGKLKLYRCYYKGTRLHLEQVDVMIPTREDLHDSTTTYVLDGAHAGVWMWVGSRAPREDSMRAMGNGRAFVKKKKYPYTTPVVRVIEGHEPLEFRRLFPKWNIEGEHESSSKPSAAVLTKLNTATLCQRPKMAAEAQLIDDGSGDRVIYRIYGNQVMLMPYSKPTSFITDSCYIVVYTVAYASVSAADAENVGVQSIVYQWKGSEATGDTIHKADILFRSEVDKLTDRHMYVVMCEFDETPHFLQVFNGTLIVLQADPKLNNNNDPQLYSKSHQQYVLRIHGDASYNSKAVQVQLLPELNCKECYIVKTNHVWLWCGQSSTGDAREVARKIGGLLGESSLVMEGKEPQEFWSHLHQVAEPLCQVSCSHSPLSSNATSIGSGKSSPQSHLGTKPHKAHAHLYLVWTRQKQFYSMEIINYDQSDLSPEATYVLDAGLLTFVWIGRFVAKADSIDPLALGQQYLDSLPIARRPSTAMAVVKQFDEPNVFKGFFNKWDHGYCKNYISYEQHRKRFDSELITNGNGYANGNGATTNGNSVLTPDLLNRLKEFDRHAKYPFEMLQQEREALPADIDPLSRELHLTHDDFVAVFNMPYTEYEGLPGWKKQELKKKHKLF